MSCLGIGKKLYVAAARTNVHFQLRATSYTKRKQPHQIATQAGQQIGSPMPSSICAANVDLFRTTDPATCFLSA